MSEEKLNKRLESLIKKGMLKGSIAILTPIKGDLLLSDMINRNSLLTKRERILAKICFIGMKYFAMGTIGYAYGYAAYKAYQHLL